MSLANALHALPGLRVEQYFGIHLVTKEPGDKAELPGLARLHRSISTVGADGIQLGLAWHCAKGRALRSRCRSLYVFIHIPLGLLSFLLSATDSIQVWYFFNDVYPSLNDGQRPLDPPAWWRRIFEARPIDTGAQPINNEIAAAAAPELR